MKKSITDEEEVQLYFIFCDISKICKKYFFERKHLPKDTWSIDKVINKLSLSTKKLKSKYSEMKKDNSK